MSWQNAVDSSQEWLQDSGKDFTLTNTDREARVIHFRASHGSFYVTVPEKQGIEEWVYIILLPAHTVYWNLSMYYVCRWCGVKTRVVFRDCLTV